MNEEVFVPTPVGEADKVISNKNWDLFSLDEIPICTKNKDEYDLIEKYKKAIRKSANEHFGVHYIREGTDIPTGQRCMWGATADWIDVFFNLSKPSRMKKNHILGKI